MIGTLGVIGPTRMAYERVIPIVDLTAKLLSNALTQQLADRMTRHARRATDRRVSTRRFARRDATAMAACYAPDARFTDPVFDLAGAEIGAMWAMLCARGKDLTRRMARCAGRRRRGQRALGAATIRSRPPAGPSHNVIDATFVFRDGRIVEHVDRFDLWRWSRHGARREGLLLGWTPLVRNAVRAQARKGLDAWMARAGG